MNHPGFFEAILEKKLIKNLKDLCEALMHVEFENSLFHKADSVPKQLDNNSSKSVTEFP